MTRSRMLSSLKWIGVGACLGAIVLWRLLRKPRPALKQEVDAAVEREKANVVKAEPVPTDLNEVKKRLREKGLLS